MNTDKPIKPDWVIVEFDETSYWNFPEEDMKWVEKMMGVYCFNRNQVTYMCEMRPSYALHFFRTVVHYTDEFYQWLSDEENSAESWRDKFEMDVAMSDQSEPVRYYHCSYMDSYLEQNRYKRGSNKVYEIIGNIVGKFWKEESEEDQVDGIREYFQTGSSSLVC